MAGAVGVIRTEHDLSLLCTPSVPFPPHRPSTLLTPAGGSVREVISGRGSGRVTHRRIGGDAAVSRRRGVGR